MHVHRLSASVSRTMVSVHFSFSLLQYNIHVIWFLLIIRCCFFPVKPILKQWIHLFFSLLFLKTSFNLHCRTVCYCVCLFKLLNDFFRRIRTILYIRRVHVYVSVYRLEWAKHIDWNKNKILIHTHTRTQSHWEKENWNLNFHSFV